MPKWKKVGMVFLIASWGRLWLISVKCRADVCGREISTSDERFATDSLGSLSRHDDFYTH